jgi:DNA-binding response OmpR family regulator
MDNMKLLFVEDDKEINQLVTKYLLKNGFRVDSIYNGIDAIAMLQSNDYQMAIIDLLLPFADGYEVLRKIREKGNMPVLILSAKSTEADKIIGLGLGADDYLTKPFSIEELIARVKAQLRRYINFGNLNSEGSIIQHMGLEIDSNAHTVKVNGKTVALTLKEYEILILLMKHPRIVFTKAQIFNLVWNEDYMSDDNTLMVHIRRLREKIETDPSNPKYIQTIWGIGYKLGEE